MRYPNFSEENRIRKKGYRLIAGLDEAGRGPLAGPVIAVAVTILKDRGGRLKPNDLIREVNDSKKISVQKRKKICELLIKAGWLKWGMGRVSERVIDKINIFEATRLAMKRAVKNLNSKLQEIDCKVDYLILDGNFKLNLNISQKSIVRADEKVFSCAAASIIAKVNRDRIMERYHGKYPRYGFIAHKGYPTKYHFKTLEKFGASKIHRKTFKPVKRVLKLE